MKEGKRPKIFNLIWKVKELLEKGSLRYSVHAEERMAEREIIKPEVEYILRKGHHNQKKDKFNDLFGSWDYAIEGKTIDNRKLRVILVYVEPNILVVQLLTWIIYGKKSCKDI